MPNHRRKLDRLEPVVKFEPEAFETVEINTLQSLESIIKVESKGFQQTSLIDVLRSKANM